MDNAHPVEPSHHSATTGFSLGYLLRLNRPVLVRAVPLLIVNRVSVLLLPFSGKYLIDDVVGRGDLHALGPLFGVLLAASILNAVTNSTVTSMVDKSSQNILARVRETLQEHILRLPVPYHDSCPTGALTAHVINDVETMRTLVGPALIDFVGSILSCILIFAVLIYLSPLMTFLVVCFLAIFLPAILAWIGGLSRLQEKYLHLQRSMAGILSSALGGVRAVKAHCSESRVDRNFRRFSRRIAWLTHTIAHAVVLRSSIATVLIETVFVLTLILGVRQVLAGSMSLGDFFVYSTFLRLLSMPLNQITSLWNQLHNGMAAVKTVGALFSRRREDHTWQRNIVMQHVDGYVEFDDVCFSYDSETAALKNVSFIAEPDTVTAVVGHSGAGKSTIANLVALFYEPSSGMLRIDGCDACRIQHESYRRHLGIVLQEPTLLNGTIRENVYMANRNAEDWEFEFACHLARLDELAMALPRGYETAIGERGIRLSGGQRQRIALARVVLANPRILVLDEATSNIDTISAASIEDDLTQWMRQRTTFIISHRLNAIRNADQILVLENGAIVECGTHQSLIDTAGVYARLYRSQYVPAGAA